MKNPFDGLKDEIVGGVEGAIQQAVGDGVGSIIDDILGGGGEGGTADGTEGKGLLAPVIMSKTKLRQLAPYMSGRAYIVFTKRPAFMAKLHPQKTKEFFHILESFNIGISGIADDTLNLDAIELGRNSQTMHVATGLDSGTDTITINLPYELSGSPVSRYVDVWANGIIDKYTGLGTYHGQIENGTFARWSNENHTAEFIYIVTDTTGKNIEYAAYGFNMHPTSVMKGHYEFDSSSVAHAAISVALTGQVITGDANLYSVAKSLVSKIYKNRVKSLDRLTGGQYSAAKR